MGRRMVAKQKRGLMPKAGALGNASCLTPRIVRLLLVSVPDGFDQIRHLRGLAAAEEVALLNR